MISPVIAKKARDSAGYHVRLRVSSVEANESYDGGPCVANVVVVSVFRGDGALAVGQTIPVQVFCFVPPDGSPTGPTWLDFSTLQVGAALEAFLNRSASGQFEVAMFQIAFASGADDRPADALWLEPSSGRKPGWLSQVVAQVKGALGFRAGR